MGCFGVDWGKGWIGKNFPEFYNLYILTLHVNDLQIKWVFKEHCLLLKTIIRYFWSRNHKQ